MERILVSVGEVVGRLPIFNQVASAPLWVLERVVTGRMLYLELARGIKPSPYRVEMLHRLRGWVWRLAGSELRPHYEFNTMEKMIKGKI